MAANEVIKGTASSGARVAVYDFTEGGNTRVAQRVALNDDAGINMMADGTSRTPAAVSVTTSATQLVGTRATRLGVILSNASSKDVFIGFNSSGVTTSSGLLLPGGASLTIMGIGVYRGVIYGIVVTGTADVRVQEWYV